MIPGKIQLLKFGGGKTGAIWVLATAPGLAYLSPALLIDDLGQTGVEAAVRLSLFDAGLDDGDTR